MWPELLRLEWPTQKDAGKDVGQAAIILLMRSHPVLIKDLAQNILSTVGFWVLGLWAIFFAALSHGSEDLAHETLEALPFVVVTATAREAYLATFLTDDLVDVETLTADGNPPGLRALSAEELHRLSSADLIFLGREWVDDSLTTQFSSKLVRLPEWPEPPAGVAEKDTRGPTEKSLGKKTKRPAPQPVPGARCKNMPVFAPPNESLAIARELATVLAQRLPQMTEKIERNFLFLKSELGIFDALLRDLQAPAAQRGFLAPACVFRFLAEDYHFALVAVEWADSAEVTEAVFQRDCRKTGQPSCLVLRLDAPARQVGGDRSPAFKPPGVVLNAGLRKPIRANVFADYQAQLEILRVLLTSP